MRYGAPRCDNLSIIYPSQSRPRCSLLSGEELLSIPSIHYCFCFSYLNLLLVVFRLLVLLLDSQQASYPPTNYPPEICDALDGFYFFDSVSLDLGSADILFGRNRTSTQYL